MGDSLAVAGGLDRGLLGIAGEKDTRRWLPRSVGSGRGGRSGSYRADYVAFGGLPAEPGGSGRANGGEGYQADDALQRAVCTKKTWVEGREGSSVISPVRSAKGLEGKLRRTHGRADRQTSDITRRGSWSYACDNHERPRLLCHQYIHHPQYGHRGAPGRDAARRAARAQRRCTEAAREAFMEVGRQGAQDTSAANAYAGASSARCALSSTMP